jgi:lichenan operon transcriptional antiterminator
VKKLFTDNRTAGILRMLGTKSGLTVAVMAEQLGVSERTIRNDIRQLNEDLAGSASIEGVQGRYSLRIFDPAAYKKTFEKSATQTVFLTRRGDGRTMSSEN